MKTIDERLETAAHEVQRAVTEVPGRPGEGAVRGHRVARVARAVAAMALAVAAIGGTALLMDGDGAGDVASGASGFPTLTLDIDALGADLRLVYADDETAIAGASAECGNCEVLPSGQPSAHLVVYGDRSEDAADGRIWVSFDPRGSDMFRADAFDDEPGWEPIAVPTGSAYLHEGPAAAIILWEVAPGGTVVELREMGLGSEELLSVLISVDLSSETVAVTALPAGFTELYSGPQGLINGERVVSMIWAAEPDASASVEISLWIHEGGPDGFERDLYGFAPYSEVVSAVEVRGATGVRLEGPGLTLFEWMETPDHFARLLVHGSVDPDAVLDALVEVDEATWRRMLESAEPFDESGPYNVTTTIAPSEG